MAAADFDEDGKLDVVVLGTGTGGAHMLQGTGNGFFGPPVSIYNHTARDVIARDLNGDTNIDLLIIGDGWEQLVFLPGHGDGTFGTEELSGGLMGNTFAVADFTGDDVEDVAAYLTEASGSSLILFAGNGQGRFAEVRRVALAAAPGAIAAGDLDADGAADLVVSYPSLTTLDLFYGNDDGTFDPAVSKQSGPGIAKVTVADAEGDGDLDILVPRSDQALTVHRNLGGRLFDLPFGYAFPSFPDGPPSIPSDIAAADTTGDGLPDMITATVHGYFIVTNIGIGDGTFGGDSSGRFYGREAPSGRIGAIADLNGDHRLDIIGTQAGFAGRVVVLMNHCGDAQVDLETETPTISAGQNARVRVAVSTFLGYTPADVAGTGTVSIVEGETVLATGQLSGGEAWLDIPGLTLGDHTLVARYAGDLQYEPADSAAIVQHVTSDVTTTTVTTEPSPSIYGQEVLVRAVVTSSGATAPSGGTIAMEIGTFYWEGEASPAGGTTRDLPVGSRTARAWYMGDATHAPSGLASVVHDVLQATPKVSISPVLLNPSGSSVKLWVYTNPEFAGSPANPTGLTSLYDGNALAGTMEAGYPAIFELHGLAAGRHDFRVKYSGDTNYRAAESPLATHQTFPPSGLHVEARGSTAGIHVIWPYPAGASDVYVMRTIAPSLDFAHGYGISGLYPQPMLDQQTTAGVVYLYRLEVRDPATQAVTGTSAIDLGVRMAFSDDPLIAGMTVRASHVQEILAATNFLRGKAGQAAVTFNDVAVGTLIRASHITTLRTKINEARVALGAAPVTFVRTIAPGDAIRAQDLQELREAVH